MEKLKLINFKCFVDNEINFRKCTILAGNNAAGKSSIIQALLLYGACVNIKENNLLLKDILHMQVGNIKRLVSQRAKKQEDMDFGIDIDGKTVGFSKDRYNPGSTRVDIREKFKIPEIVYLSAERIGPRLSYAAEGADIIDAHGKNFAYIMELADREGVSVPDCLMVDNTSGKFSYQVECWMNLIMDSKIQIGNLVNFDDGKAEIKFKNEYTDIEIVPTLTGFGISYCLSIIVAGLWCAVKGNKLFIVENPEAHLHPFAQSAMGKFLALISQAGVQVIIETHSEHVVDGARIQMYSMDAQDEFVANFLSRDEERVNIKELYIEENGELSDWPAGFFDQKQLDLRNLFKIRIENADNK